MTQRTAWIVMALVAALPVVVPGCTSPEATGEAAIAPASLAVCSDCGHLKGTPACCGEDAERCDQCGLAKGSPGCCRLDPDAAETARLCAKCGQFKGTPECCAENAERCDECGLVKGSPGCCKIE